MLCCGINSFKVLEQYFKNYLIVFGIRQTPNLDFSGGVYTLPDIGNEWENIST